MHLSMQVSSNLFLLTAQFSLKACGVVKFQHQHHKFKSVDAFIFTSSKYNLMFLSHKCSDMECVMIKDSKYHRSVILDVGVYMYVEPLPYDSAFINFRQKQGLVPLSQQECRDNVSPGYLESWIFCRSSMQASGGRNFHVGSAAQTDGDETLNILLIDGTWSNSAAMFSRLKEHAKSVWGEDISSISLSTGVSAMHKLRPQPSWNTCTAAAAIGLLSELQLLPQFSAYGLDEQAEAVEDALVVLLEALTARSIIRSSDS